MSPEVEFVFSFAGLILALLLTWGAFTEPSGGRSNRAKWAAQGIPPPWAAPPDGAGGDCPPATTRTTWAAAQTAGYRVDPETGCWNWTGTKMRGGYGGQGGRHAHRVAWELLVGPVSEGHDLHHLCGSRACVNPDHLEPRLPHEHRGRNGMLTEAQLDRILALVRDGKSLIEIARGGIPRHLGPQAGWSIQTGFGRISRPPHSRLTGLSSPRRPPSTRSTRRAGGRRSRPFRASLRNGIQPRPACRFWGRG